MSSPLSSLQPPHGSHAPGRSDGAFDHRGPAPARRAEAAASATTCLDRIALAPLAPRPLRPHRGIPGQLLFRELNEEIVARRPIGADGTIDAVCECDRLSCTGGLRLSTEEYERVRRFPTRFAVRPGHVSPDERVVDARPDYVVVEKLGAAARIAIRLDPRRVTPREAA